MSDLIDRHAAIDALEKESQLDGAYGYMDTKSIVDCLNDLPSAQPEIIYCKDCINWDTTWTNDCTPNYHYCPLIDGVRKDNFYCADAERRTDGRD